MFWWTAYKLKHGSQSQKIDAIATLQRIGDQRAVQSLTEVLCQSDQPDLRARAALSLATMVHPETTHAVAAALRQEPDANVCAVEAETLWKLGWFSQKLDASCLDIVQKVILHSAGSIREAAQKAQHVIQKDLERAEADRNASLTRRIATLVQQLANVDRQTRISAVKVLRTLQWQPSSQRETALWAVARDDVASAVAAGPLADDLVAILLADQRFRSTIAKAVMEGGEESCLRQVANLAEDRDEETALLGIQALGRLGDTPSLNLLLGILEQHPSYSKRAVFSRAALVQMPEVASAALRQGVHERKPYAVEILGRIGNPEAVPLIAEALRIAVETKHGPLQDAALTALRNIHHPGCVSALLSCPEPYESSGGRILDETLCLFARDGLITSEELAPALAHGHTKLRIAAANALAEIGGKPVVRLLTQELHAATASIVLPEIAAALGKLGDADAIHPLGELLNKKFDYRVARILGAFGPAGESYLIRALLREKATDEECASLAEVLESVGTSEAIEPLLETCSDKVSGIRAIRKILQRNLDTVSTGSLDRLRRFQDVSILRFEDGSPNGWESISCSDIREIAETELATRVS